MTTQTATPESRRVRACHRAIVAALEAGTRPWLRGRRPGRRSCLPPLRYDGTPYRGVNVLLLYWKRWNRVCRAVLDDLSAGSKRWAVRFARASTGAWWCTRMRSTRPRSTGNR